MNLIQELTQIKNKLAYLICLLANQEAGPAGQDGKSAYQIALDNGFVGTVQEWLLSLVGATGADGKSAYQIAVEEGFNGSESEWLLSLIGKSAYQIALDNGFVGTQTQWLDSLNGEDGESSTINIGTVISLPSGAVPTVTNSGTDINAILNFGIPKGDQGVPGAQGIPGTNAQSFNYKGAVPTYSGLPNTGNVINDAYYNRADSLWYIYNGTTFPVNGEGVSLGTSNLAQKVPFTATIKFNQPKKYSTINQSGNINFVYDASGTEKPAIIKIEVISDGIGDINFTSDFEVIGGSTIDKTKNQVIYFSRESVVEFKVTAVIMNVAKSGNTTPVNLDPDAQIYYDRLVAAGATITPSLTNAINTLYLSAKANGYYSKLKGLYLALGNTTASRLVNGIAGRPDALLSIGTVTNDGIVGVLDSQMKPSDIFSLSSFSYGINNSTPIYTNYCSMGCNTSATSGIVLICVATSPSGQFLFSGPNRDLYANAAMADSLGTYIVSRTGASLAKLFKNGSLYFTHTTPQGAATLPNINFAIGGNNTNGVFEDDGRTTKWAFLGDGLTDAECVAIGTDLNNLMTAIGR